MQTYNNPVEYAWWERMNCFCCSRTLLRHIDRDGLYWYCTTCRQSLPVSLKENLWVRLCHKKQPYQNDSSSNFNYDWQYIPLKPTRRKVA